MSKALNKSDTSNNKSRTAMHGTTKISYLWTRIQQFFTYALDIYQKKHKSKDFLINTLIKHHIEYQHGNAALSETRTKTDKRSVGRRINESTS